jgi:hypothetical protein
MICVWHFGCALVSKLFYLSMLQILGGGGGDTGVGRLTTGEVSFEFQNSYII